MGNLGAEKVKKLEGEGKSTIQQLLGRYPRVRSPRGAFSEGVKAHFRVNPP